jgi:hypothetical protein
VIHFSIQDQDLMNCHSFVKNGFVLLMNINVYQANVFQQLGFCDGKFILLAVFV